MTTYLAPTDSGMSKGEQRLRLKRHAMARRIRAAVWTSLTLVFAITVVGLVVDRLIT